MADDDNRVTVPADSCRAVLVSMEQVLKFMDSVDYRWPSDEGYEQLKGYVSDLRAALGPDPEPRRTEIPAVFLRAFGEE